MSLVELREQVRAVVLRSVAVEDFEDWLVSHSWNMHKWAPPEIQRLVSYLELRLAERSSGHLPEEELLHEFAVRLAQLDAPNMPLRIRQVVSANAVSILSTAASGASAANLQQLRIKLAQASDAHSISESSDNAQDLNRPRRAELTGV